MMFACPDNYETAPQPVAVLGFLDLHRAVLVEPLGIQLRESRRHVLNNNGCRRIRRQIFDHLFQRLGASGGSAKCKHDIIFAKPLRGRGEAGMYHFRLLCL